MIKPISPDEVAATKRKNIPEGVIECWNKAIAQNYNSGYATIMQNSIIEAICQKMDCSRAEVFLNHWLDIEELYINEGWSVTYDKPGYNETYEASFKFKRKVNN